MNTAAKIFKFKKFLHLLRRSLMILVLVLLIVYAGLAIYVKHLAEELLNQDIMSIENLYPNITEIHYQQVQFSPIDFLKQQLSINDISFHVNSPELQVHLDQIDIKNFLSFNQDPFGPFSIRIKKLSVDQFANLYGLIAISTNSPYLYSEFGNLPNNLNLSLDGNIDYLPNDNLSTHIQLNLSANQTNIFNYQAVIAELPLNQTFFTDADCFMKAINQSQIESFNYVFHLQHNFSLAEISNVFPETANFLGELGYQSLSTDIEDDSSYNAGNANEINHLNVNIQNLGSLQSNITYQINQTPSLADNVNQWLNSTDPSVANIAINLIQSATITYQDASLMHRLLQWLAQNTGNSINNTQSMLTTLINGMAQNLNIPQINVIATQLNNFISNPGALTLGLNPAKPFALETVLAFFQTQQQRNVVIQQQLAQLPSNQRATAYQTYLTQSLNAYSNFFNRLGLSLIANTTTN